jgi:preprotein translocase subunit SecF
MFHFSKYRKIYFVFSGLLIISSLISLAVWGLKPGIEFTGGSILELQYQDNPPSNQIIKQTLSDFDLGEIYIQPTGERGVILRMKHINEKLHQQVLKKLRINKEIDERRFESIGPVIGKELKEKTKFVILIALFSIVLYITLSFRRLKEPFKSWQYGIVTLLALSHDVLIPLGIFSILGKYQGVEITIPIIAGLLTVFGYSVNDTVVVFDRIRENLLKRTGITFEEIINKSLNQTLARSISTSLTTLFVLISLFFLGGETLKYFSLVLILGISFGTYSSIFIASPLLVSWFNWKKRKFS